MRVLALDPGRCSGYALAYKDEESFDLCYAQAEWSHIELYEFIWKLRYTYIICESFEFRQGKQLGVDLYPCELIGIVKLLSPEVFMQPASVQGKKAYFSDNKLKQMGLYVKGVEHGRSAVKHLLQWFYHGSGYRFMAMDQDPQLVQEDWFRSKYL